MHADGEVQVVAADATIAPSTTAAGTASHDNHAEETGAVTAVTDCHMDDGAL
jgi:hypothetical protein